MIQILRSLYTFYKTMHGIVKTSALNYCLSLYTNYGVLVGEYGCYIRLVGALSDSRFSKNRANNYFFYLIYTVEFYHYRLISTVDPHPSPLYKPPLSFPKFRHSESDRNSVA
ncbi:hypothetical protein RIF29_16770 [Crotalaria pallida]|uniref:Uncharacterized protein n=1 Tax=Crotalaria pallida TaxID=3830 RepID=A0AAN9IFV4_CROPI